VIVARRPLSSAARPVNTGVVKTAAAALNAYQGKDSTTVLTTDDGHDDGVEDRVDGKHVETDVDEHVEAVSVDDVVVGQ